MPIEIPEVRVVDDPMVVYFLVALFAAAALLALYFATPWASRMPRSADVEADTSVAERATLVPQPPAAEAHVAPSNDQQARPVAKVPWSTATPDADPPWHARPGAPTQDD